MAVLNSSRLINTLLFLFISLAFTFYLFNQAFLSENTYINSTSLDYSNIQALYAGVMGDLSKDSADNNIVVQTSNVPHKTPQSTSNSINNDFQKQVDTLLYQLNRTLTWLSKEDPANKESFARWDKIATSELHLMRKLALYINKNANNIKLEDIQRGYQCNDVQKEQQRIISQLIQMDICSEIEWYKLAQLTYPDAKLIFDIGANKGYLGSLFYSLWAGGGHGLNPISIFEEAKSSDAWTSSRNPAGYCRDGLNYGIQLYCHRSGTDKLLGRDGTTGQCVEARDDVMIHSFDGSSYLQQIVTSLKNKIIPDDTIWTYHHNAVSDSVGKTRFTKQNATRNPGFEGGQLRSIMKSDEETEEVAVITVEYFLQQHKLVNQLDILKIDAEDSDYMILKGAKNSIESSIKLFTFEGGGGVGFSKKISDEYDNLGYSCYSTSRAGLFKWSGNCMSDAYFEEFRKKDKGNIFCVSRTRATLMAFAFDVLSFPVLIQTAPWDPFNGINQTYDVNTLELSDLKKTFINIKKFCSPFPSCINREL